MAVAPSIETKGVFISYRHDSLGSLLAHSLKGELQRHGYDVYIDVDGARAGEWFSQLQKEVRGRPHFLVLLTPGALDRCAEAGDMLAQEFAWARASRRNIVPVREASVEITAARESCPEAMRSLFDYQVVTVGAASFERDVDTLAQRYISPRNAAAPLAVLVPLEPGPPEQWERSNWLLVGGSPIEKDIAQGLDFPRRVQTRVLRAITAHAGRPLFLVFLAAEQMGKTTFLLRIGRELHQHEHGYTVFRLPPSGYDKPYGQWLEQLAASKRRVVLLIDGPGLEPKNQRPFSEEMNYLHEHNVPVTVLVAEQRDRWARIDLKGVGRIFRPFSLDNAEGEAGDLIRHLERTGVITRGTLKDRKVRARVRNIQGGPGYFSRVIDCVRRLKDPAFRTVNELVLEARQRGDTALDDLYTLVCLTAGTGGRLPRDAAESVLGPEVVETALAYCAELPVSPIRQQRGALTAAHPKRAREYLWERDAAETVRRLVRKLLHGPWLGELAQKGLVTYWVECLSQIRMSREADLLSEAQDAAFLSEKEGGDRTTEVRDSSEDWASEDIWSSEDI